MTRNESISSRARVLIVDDNWVVRRLLAGIIRSDEALEFVGEATNGEAALEAVRTYAPDVLCLDSMLPALDGLGVWKRYAKERPKRAWS